MSHPLITHGTGFSPSSPNTIFISADNGGLTPKFAIVEQCRASNYDTNGNNPQQSVGFVEIGGAQGSAGATSNATGTTFPSTEDWSYSSTSYCVKVYGTGGVANKRASGQLVSGGINLTYDISTNTRIVRVMFFTEQGTDAM